MIKVNALSYLFGTYNPDNYVVLQSKAVQLHAMEAHGGRGGIALTHT
jgi:hypothetical protein